MYNPIVGLGFTIRQDDPIDWKEESGRLLIRNDSRQRVGMYPGVAIFLVKDSFGPFVSANLVSGSQSVINGLTVGLAYRPKKDVGFGFFGGYSRSLGQELSLGFKRFAMDALETQPSADYFKQFKDLPRNGPSTSKPGFKREKDYDGFPTVLPNGSNSTRVFPGTPIVDSYNTSWSFGIFLDSTGLGNLFRKK